MWACLIKIACSACLTCKWLLSFVYFVCYRDVPSLTDTLALIKHRPTDCNVWIITIFVMVIKNTGLTHSQLQGGKRLKESHNTATVCTIRSDLAHFVIKCIPVHHRLTTALVNIFVNQMDLIKKRTKKSQLIELHRKTQTASRTADSQPRGLRTLYLMS